MCVPPVLNVYKQKTPLLGGAWCLIIIIHWIDLINSVEFSMKAQDKISKLRKNIDTIDYKIIDLLDQRFSISKEIGEIKSSHDINVDDPNREKQIIDRLGDKMTGKLDKEEIIAIFEPIYNISKRLQKK